MKTEISIHGMTRYRRWKAMEFHSGLDLLAVLKKAREIERDFESIGEWEGYIENENQSVREGLLKIILDSQNHLEMVSSMISAVKVPESSIPDDSGSVSFSFPEDSIIDALEKILDKDRLAFRLYSDIDEALHTSKVEDLLSEGAVPQFRKDLSYLIAAERNHIGLVADLMETVKKSA
jgi:rubrerythrin